MRYLYDTLVSFGKYWRKPLTRKIYVILEFRINEIRVSFVLNFTSLCDTSDDSIVAVHRFYAMSIVMLCLHETIQYDSTYLNQFFNRFPKCKGFLSFVLFSVFGDVEWVTLGCDILLPVNASVLALELGTVDWLSRSRPDGIDRRLSGVYEVLFVTVLKDSLLSTGCTYMTNKWK